MHESSILVNLGALPLLSALLACSGHVEADPAPAARSALPAAASGAEGVVIEPLAKPPVKAPSAPLPNQGKFPPPTPAP